jgi:ubiquinone/menaquinone biosynthesis C-methylase UbiE
MNFMQKIVKLSGTGFTYGQYYESMNLALKRLNDEYTMLHYPLYVNENDSFIQAQRNLTDYCISILNPLENKEVLEIGCGNGVQALYILTRYHPLCITGIDLSNANIKIANSVKEQANVASARFLVDNAQDLTRIPTDSVDVVLNIESAFHYPDKPAFLREVQRVLKPGGQFLVADILSTRTKREGIMKIWGKPMVHHFWNRKRYDEEFSKTELVISYHEDITQQVRKGWSLYRNWIPKIKRKGFFLNVALRIFYFINARLNIFFLKNRQQYCIFVGYNGKFDNRNF